MNKKQINSRIRADIVAFVLANGNTDTRVLIKILAQRFNTTKQRISGNISFIVAKQGLLSITTIAPNKESYIH